ncbi:putative cytochrome b5 [Cooperia oncophora]
MVTKLTRKEVADHNSSKSSWFVIGNKVYDVTKFLEEHPGGCEVLLEVAGRDATEAFEDVGHSTDAREMREQYLVGDIVEEEKQKYSYDKKEWVTSPTDNKQRNSNPWAALDTYIYPALFAIVFALIYYLITN